MLSVSLIATINKASLSNEKADRADLKRPTVDEEAKYLKSIL